MIPKSPLPISDEWENADAYVESLLSFTTSSTLFRNLCGGIHILDFLTREPDLYSTVVPADWRGFFDHYEISDILDLLMREDIDQFLHDATNGAENQGDGQATTTWRNDGPAPPKSLVEYIQTVRRHALVREFMPRIEQDIKRPVGKRGIPHHVATGMKPKKCHEVENFSDYVSRLTEDVGRIRRNGSDGDGQEEEDSTERISHIVDFGSGLNYLGRTLASPPYNKHIIAIERRQNNITVAKGKDVHARLAKKTIMIRNKKELRALARGEVFVPSEKSKNYVPELDKKQSDDEPEKELVTVIRVKDENEDKDNNNDKAGSKEKPSNDKQDNGKGISKGSMEYVEHEIKDGYLEPIIKHIIQPSEEKDGEDTTENISSEEEAVRTPSSSSSSSSSSSIAATPTNSKVMVVSLHSCGNLVHHGIRSLIINPSVVAIAMIGCCYNLVTERLGPPTYKVGPLRNLHPRVDRESKACDPHGFPMSKRLEDYTYDNESGIRLNITARSMAVQAPYNWGREDSEAFFTRHYYRALLQRVLVDYGIVPTPGTVKDSSKTNIGGKEGCDDCEGGPPEENPGTPLIVGSLRKSAFVSFPAYARAAIVKLARDPQYGELIDERLGDVSDETLLEYDDRYCSRKKDLSIAWSLMAFSASVTESIIVTDRWLFLREQKTVKDAWVEPVFNYAHSPRNLVVVGIKH